MFKWWYRLLIVDFIVLMWVGGQTPTELTSWISLIAAAYWFAYFLVILPLLGLIEKPLPQPATIEDDFNAHYGAKTHAAE
jgi:ubiquinol-cytochrome c reductase cytochrome b subunit